MFLEATWKLESPSGKASRRETLEETGLVIDDVLREFEELDWVTLNGKHNVQLNFVATVRNLDSIVLSAREHETWMWATKGDLTQLPCSKGMTKVFQDAFEYVERRSEEGTASDL